MKHLELDIAKIKTLGQKGDGAKQIAFIPLGHPSKNLLTVAEALIAAKSAPIMVYEQPTLYNFKETYENLSKENLHLKPIIEEISARIAEKERKLKNKNSRDMIDALKRQKIKVEKNKNAPKQKSFTRHI